MSSEPCRATFWPKANGWAATPADSRSLARFQYTLEGVRVLVDCSDSRCLALSVLSQCFAIYRWPPGRQKGLAPQSVRLESSMNRRFDCEIIGLPLQAQHPFPEESCDSKSNVRSQSATTLLLSGNLQIPLADSFRRAQATPMHDSSFDNPPEDQSDR